MATGKIKTLFSDIEKTEALFPRTKTSAVSNNNGVGLDALLNNINAEIDTKATESFVTNKIAEAQLNGGSGDIDLSGYATKDDIKNIDFPVDSVNGKTGTVTLSAVDMGAVLKAGDTMTGDLYITKNLPMLCLNAPIGSSSVFKNANAEADYGSFFEDRKQDGTVSQLFLDAAKDSTDILQLYSSKHNVIWNVLHTGNKNQITPADIGALNADNYLSSVVNISVGQNVLALPNGVYSFEVSNGVTAEMATQMNLPCVAWHYDFIVTSNHTVGASGKDTQLYKTILCFISDGSVFKNNCAWEQWTGWKRLLNNDTTPADIGAAPAGYGLGEYAPFITDANEAILPGFYRFDSSKTCTNIPGEWQFPYGTMIVSRGSAYIEQLFLAREINAKRTCTNGTWGEWEYINPPMVVGVKYRTIERWNNKAVYTLLLDLGTTTTDCSGSVNIPGITSLVRAVPVLDDRLCTDWDIDAAVHTNNQFYFCPEKVGEIVYFYMHCGAYRTGKNIKAQIWYTK